eukprot:Gb_24246 [translate_table: standard]
MPKKMAFLFVCIGRSAASMAIPIVFLLLILLLIYKMICWLSPHQMKQKMQNQGIPGPNPHFLLGNLFEMKKIVQKAPKENSLTHNLEPRLFPYLVQWRKQYGKKFVYWLGSEAVLYIQEPELINEISSSGSFNWGRPAFLKNDRKPLFGNGLITAEADDWIHQRRLVGKALAAEKVKGMLGTVIESAMPIFDDWAKKIMEGGKSAEIEVDGDLSKATAEIISKALFGRSYEKGFEILDKLKTLQKTIFKSNRFVGVPGSRFIPTSTVREARKLGKEADFLILQIIRARLECRSKGDGDGDDLLGIMLSESEEGIIKGKHCLTIQDVVDECKTLLIAGQETTKLSLTWTMMLLALNPDWQEKVRAEVMETMGTASIPDMNMLPRMKTMSMVVKESMRLYPPVAYTVRQAREEMQLGGYVIPKGMSVFINIVGMHEDPDIWGHHDVYQFNPLRFSDDVEIEKKKRFDGFIPFGFGGRICVGERVATVEQKVILSLILSKFSFSLSPNYIHSPTSLLSIVPSHGMHLLFHKL